MSHAIEGEGEDGNEEGRRRGGNEKGGGEGGEEEAGREGEQETEKEEAAQRGSQERRMQQQVGKKGEERDRGGAGWRKRRGRERVAERATKEGIGEENGRYDEVTEKHKESILLLSTEEIKYEQTQAEGYLNIVFNFYQISNLLLISTSVGKLLETKAIPPIVGLFNFQQRFSSDGLVCPFPGLTARTKKLLEITLVFGTVVAVFLVYALHSLLCRLLRKNAPCFAPYLGENMAIILLGYATVAKIGLSFVHCVPVGPEYRWFYNGTVICFQWWQYVFMVLNIVFVVPFMFVLAWGSMKLCHGKISAKQLLLASVFPLPFLVFWLVCSILGDANIYGNNEYTEALKEVLQGPFRRPKRGTRGALYWQSVLIGRRFILVSLYCFVQDSSLRLLCMALVCFFACLHHLYVRPFQNPRANFAETMSLGSLVILAVINTYKSVVVANVSEVKDPLVSVFQAFDWIEIVLLGILPAVFFLVICLGVMSFVLRFGFVMFGYLYKILAAGYLSKWKSSESHPLLGATNKPRN